MCRRRILFTAMMCRILPLIGQEVPVPLREEMVETQQEAVAGSVAQELADPEEIWMLDLNAEDMAEIVASPLLNPEQGAAILRHREQFGRFIAVEELQVSGAFDADEIRKLKPFLRCGKPLVDAHFHFNEIMASAHHEALVRMRRVLQEKEGFSGDGIYPFYKGDPNQINFRYRMQAGRYFSAGFVIEKDAGETLLSKNNGGRMDFFSWHVFLKPERLIETIAIGDYQVQYGQGLVAWSGISLGKSSEVQQFYRRGLGIRPYSSSGEAEFKRGIAVSMAVQKWKLDLWTSYRNLDASLFPADTNFTSFLVSSINESGLHRTAEEVQHKAVLSHFMTGAHLQWQNQRLRNEITFQYQHFGFPLWPGDDPYEKYDPSGSRFANAGWAWRYLLPNATFFSELAADAEFNPALVSGVLFMPDRQWTISLHYRNYSRSYQCIGCDALREGSKTQNEKGFLSGIAWQITNKLKWQAYLDYFNFPWLRYTTTAPASGKEWLTQFTYVPARGTEIYLRFKQDEKPNDELIYERKIPLPVSQRNIRFHLRWMYGKNWEMQTRIEKVLVMGSGAIQQGTMCYQECRYKPLGKRYSFAVRWSVFNTDSYDARIYTYEQDMSGAFSLPAYSGKGYRYYFLFRYRLLKGLDIWLRFSSSVFPESTNTPDPIENRDEVKAQIRWQF